ncbi:hypothetical protein BASA81_002810 [Batrachochytrium salamandrivorans]|nr:hypothetical protein BASA81_003531 [Batrachochytrium salamandrivorans]KAH9259190.1 hypothetical protein BASA81_002810 [Batrachochytrium salamandrivorans]
MFRSSALRAFTTASKATPRFKHSTGLVGLEVDHFAREKLLVIYQQTLDEVKHLNDDFKHEVIALTEYRLSVCQKLEDPEEIENEIQSGQIEELLDEAKDELHLVKFLIKDENKKNPNYVFHQQ